MKTKIVLMLLGVAAPLAHAGRPLTVDDANVNETGQGHVEAWYARQPGKLNTWTVAPAFAPVNGLEVSGAFSRDTTTPQSSTALQVKWRITPSQAEGCNFGLVVGALRQPGNGNTPYLNGLGTCNGTWGSLHLNLGANRAPGGPTLRTWSMALERDLGFATGHVEWFGQQQQGPTAQLGLRFEPAKNWQIDGTLGRQSGETLYSLGLKRSF